MGKQFCVAVDGVSRGHAVPLSPIGLLIDELACVATRTKFESSEKGSAIEKSFHFLEKFFRHWGSTSLRARVYITEFGTPFSTV